MPEGGAGGEDVIDEQHRRRATASARGPQLERSLLVGPAQLNAKAVLAQHRVPAHQQIASAQPQPTGQLISDQTRQRVGAALPARDGHHQNSPRAVPGQRLFLQGAQQGLQQGSDHSGIGTPALLVEECAAKRAGIGTAAPPGQGRQATQPRCGQLQPCRAGLAKAIHRRAARRQCRRQPTAEGTGTCQQPAQLRPPRLPSRSRPCPARRGGRRLS